MFDTAKLRNGLLLEIGFILISILIGYSGWLSGVWFSSYLSLLGSIFLLIGFLMSWIGMYLIATSIQRSLGILLGFGVWLLVFGLTYLMHVATSGIYRQYFNQADVLEVNIGGLCTFIGFVLIGIFFI